MEKSEQLNELAAALTAAQAEIDDAEKSRQNPAFRSKYADLGACWDACKPALTKHGLSVAQFSEPGPEGHLMLTTMLLHKSGQFLSGTALIPLVKNDPQAYGSAITYGRRYGLSAMVGICPADDDGNAASGRQDQVGRWQPPRQESRGDRAATTGQQRTQQSVQGAEKSNAYAFETGARQQDPPTQEPEELTLDGGAGLFCANDECAASLTQGQYNVSLKNYGRGFCPRCQRTQQKVA